MKPVKPVVVAPIVEPVDGKLPIAVITNCSATRTVTPEVRGIDLPEGLTMEEGAKEWVKRLTEWKGERLTPSELYRGLSFHSIVKMQEYVKPERIWIASSGHGLVRLTEKLTPYEFTTHPGHSDSVVQRLTKEPFVMSVWWKLISEGLYGVSYPVAQVVKDEEVKLVVIALYSRFLKLMPDDLLESGEDIDKVRIITTSATGGMPKQFAPFALRYPKKFGQNTIGNRNDLNHRAALHFIRLLAKEPELVGGQLEDHQKAVNESLGVVEDFNSRGAERVHKDEALERVFAGNPSLGEMEANEAYAKVRRGFRISIHPSKFKAAWAKYFGKDLFSELDGGVYGDNAALKALEAIKGQMVKHDRRHASIDSEQDALKVVSAFVQVMRVEGLTAVKFTSVEIVNFAEAYCKERQVEVPPQLTSALKVSFMLKNYAEMLGMENIVTDSGSKYVYRVRDMA